MKATEGRIGRVFLLRLDDGDVIPTCIEEFAREKGIAIGHVVLVGGIGAGKIVVGPRHPTGMPPHPQVLPIDGVHEVAAVGLLAPDEQGQPVLHIHGALGRLKETLAGCLRLGATTWVVGEVIIYEITGAKAVRVKDNATGFELLEVE